MTAMINNKVTMFMLIAWIHIHPIHGGIFDFFQKGRNFYLLVILIYAHITKRYFTQAIILLISFQLSFLIRKTIKTVSLKKSKENSFVSRTIFYILENQNDFLLFLGNVMSGLPQSYY